MPGSETKRLFVAAFPPREIVERLEEVILSLAADIPSHAIRWTKPEQIHLTLFFLGSIEVARIPRIQAALQSACLGHAPFQVPVSGLGSFPDINHPKILWAGLMGDLAPLENLKTSIDAKLLTCGCVGEERPFHPHLTIGRVADLNSTERKSNATRLAAFKEPDFGDWKIENVFLMESKLSSEGSTYTTLQSFPLTGS